MGTSADLAVRYRGQTYYQHASHDAHTADVVAQLASTLAAAGSDALRARLDREGPPLSKDEDCDEVFVDRRGMGNAYLAACDARSREPVLLDTAMAYEYGNPDFAHGGAIGLFAPAIDWHMWACNCIEDASFILDLDKGVIVVPLDGANYDSGAMAGWTLDLTELEALDPVQVDVALRSMTFDWEGPADLCQAALQAALAKARLGDGSESSGKPGNGNGAAFLGRRGIGAQKAFTPSVHLLRGQADHTVYFQPVVDFLRDLGEAFPPLDRPQAMRMTHPSPHEQQLVVDLRDGTVATQSLVQDLFSSLALAFDLVHVALGPTSSSTESTHSLTVIAGPGGADGKTPWDAGLVPDGAPALELSAARDASIEAFLATGDTEAAADELTFAVLGFQADRWRRVAASGLAPFPQGLRLEKLVGLAVELSRHFEQACPGSTARRFERLSEGQRSVVLEALSPVDRRLFVQLLQQGRSVADPPSAPASRKVTP